MGMPHMLGNNLLDAAEVQKESLTTRRSLLGTAITKFGISRYKVTKKDYWVSSWVHVFTLTAMGH